MQIKIINTAIRQDEHGRYSLNDLHRAAMAAAGRSGNPNDDHQRPGEFLRSAGVQAFIAALDADAGNHASVSSTKGGPNQGTYVAELVVYRYAAWVSPAFEVKVYSTFRDWARGSAGGPSNLEQLQMAEVLASALRLDGSSRLKLMADATKLLAPALAPLLPVYAIDAPAGAPAVSSAPTESLTSLMARHRVGVSTRAGNLILQERGLLEKRTRPSSAGGTKSFWSITEEGREYGKNVVHPENPRETQPHWFANRGADLLRLMGVLE